jgi:hypothetical protein
MAGFAPNSPLKLGLRIRWLAIAVTLLIPSFEIVAQDANSLSPNVFTAPVVESPFPGATPLVAPIGTSRSTVGNDTMAIQGVSFDVLAAQSDSKSNLDVLFESGLSEAVNLDQQTQALVSTAHVISAGTTESTHDERNLMAGRSPIGRLGALPLLTGGPGGAAGLFEFTRMNSKEQLGYSLGSMTRGLLAREVHPSFASNESSQYSKLDAFSSEVLGTLAGVGASNGFRAYGLSDLPSLVPPQPKLNTAVTANFTFNPMVLGAGSFKRSAVNARAGTNNGSGQYDAEHNWSTGLISVPSVRVPAAGVPTPRFLMPEREWNSVPFSE